DCDIFLFDEVLAVGDSAFQEKCFQRIQSLKQTGKTMIMASHEPAKLAQFCDEVMVMAEGKSQFIGPPHAALAFYSKHYSAEMRLDLANSLYLSNLEFLGASTISSQGDQLCSVKIGLELKSITEDTIIALSLTDSLNQLLFSGHHSISMNLMPGKPLEIEWQFSKNILNEGLFWVNLYLMKGGSLEEQFPKIGKLEVPPLQDPIRQIEAGFHALHIDSQISIKTT
ncbi:MAG: hypothetical protein HRU12_08835, partial [Phaeodactylibacter sp.]|nr:hypothetical protein [Phaeodactylibacter sp.]